MIICLPGQIWRRLPEDKKQEISEVLRNFTFSGHGQKEQPVITFPGAIKLSMFLPGENAKRNRSAMAKILVRYFAGDLSLIKEIEANARSDQPVAQMARASLAADGEEDAIAFCRKRALEELEVEGKAVALEMQKAEVRHKNALGERAENDNKIRIIRDQLGTFNDVTDRYIYLCSPIAGIDERARLIFKDSLLNFVVRFNQNQQGAIAGPDAPAPVAQPIGAIGSIGFLTISTVATDLGYRFDSAQLKRIGARIAQAYSRKYNESPKKHEQFVDGAVRRVNTYQDRDRALIEAEIHGFADQAGLAACV